MSTDTADHGAWRDLAATALDFDLTSDERDELSDHFATCASCRAWAAELDADASLLRDLPRLDAPARVRAGILAPRRSPWTVRLSLLAAMLGAVVVGIGVIVRVGGIPLGGSSGAMPEPTAAPTSVAAASSAPESPPPGGSASPEPPPAASAAPTPPIETAWVAAPPQPAFDPGAAAPELQNPCGLYYDCAGGEGDTLGPSPATAAMRAVVDTGNGIVGVGHACAAARPEMATCRAVVWRSLDGLAWDLVPHQTSLNAGTGPESDLGGMSDIIAGGPGLLAGGVTARNGHSRPTIWRSIDGTDWQRTRLPGYGRVLAVTAGHGLLLAVGRLTERGRLRAAVWLSTDGISWLRVPHTASLHAGFTNLHGALHAGIHDVIPVEDGFVAVGARCPDAKDKPCTPAVWTAGPSGLTWEVAQIDARDGSAESVARVGAGLVAVGMADGARAGIWVATDSGTWKRESVDASALAAIVATGDLAIAAGDSVLESKDGVSWTIVDDDALGPGTISGLAPEGPGVVAVGSLALEYGLRGPTAWVLAPVSVDPP